MAGGRPTTYLPEYCAMLVEHQAKGLSFESFAAVIRVSRDTLYEWAKVHEEFSDAKKEAQSQCLLFWETAGVGGMWSTAGPGNTNLNTAVWIFNMKCRFRDQWSDEQKLSFEPKKSGLTINFTRDKPIGTLPDKTDDNDVSE